MFETALNSNRFFRVAKTWMSEELSSYQGGVRCRDMLNPRLIAKDSFR